MDQETLYSLISEITCESKGISNSTRIYHDLFISGDDAYELLERIRDTFGSNLHSLDFSAYFPDETESLILYWAALLGFKSKKKEMTVGHLLEVIRKKEWFDP